MTFYFQPPVGNVAYQKLEEYALNRLRFLIRLNSCKTEDDRQDAVLDPEMVGWSDCLIAGTAKDRISHFILRQGLGCSTDTSKFVCDAETRLFRMRLDTFSLEEWFIFFTSLRKDLSRYQSEILDKLSLFYQALKNSGSDSLPSIIEGIMAKDEACYIRLPFQLVLSLVAKRQVLLNQGQAIIPLSRLPDVLEELFHGILGNMTILHQVSSQQQRSGEIKSAVDVRMTRLAAVLKRAYFGEACPTFKSPWRNAKVKAVRLDTLAASRPYFPPCMARLMADLECRHRLPHHDRIRLTLFLKELGLPVHEALLFWKREYSKAPNAGSSSNGSGNGKSSTTSTTTGTNGVGCQHSWHGNERRYTYSIRHLYGLEGKRLSYAAHSCAHIQESDRGGCPFKSIEESTTAINDFLPKEEIGLSDIEDIVSHVKNRCIEKACGLFMRSKLSKSVSASTSGDHRLSSSCSGLRNKPCCTSISCQRNRNAGLTRESRPQEVFVPSTLKKSCTSISCQRNSGLTRESRPKEVAKKARDSNTNTCNIDSVEMKEMGLRLFTEDMADVIGVGCGGSGESKTHFDSCCSCSCRCSSGDLFKFNENNGIFSDNPVISSSSSSKSFSSSSSSLSEVGRRKEETLIATTVIKKNHHLQDECESESKKVLPVVRHCRIISDDEFNDDKQIIPPCEDEGEEDEEEEVVAVDVTTTTGRTTTSTRVNQNHSSSSGVRLSLKTEFHNVNVNNEGSGGRRRRGCECEGEITTMCKKRKRKKHELHDVWKNNDDDTNDNSNDNGDNNSNNDNGEKKKICAAPGYGHETKPSHFFWSLKKSAMAAVLDS